MKKDLRNEALKFAEKIFGIEKDDDAESPAGFNLYRRKDGHPDWDEMDEWAEALANRALEVIETDSGSAEEAFSEGKRISSALATNAGSMIKNFRRIKKEKHTLIPPYFIWTMHNTCNFRCGYCDNHRGEKYFDLPNKDRLDTDGGKKLLEICRKDVTGIYFCGGEPTLRKDLPELVDYAHSLNYFPLMINTNGSRLHELITSPDSKKFLKQMDIIIVSLDALNIDSLTSVWGMKKEICEQVIVNILALRKLQKRVRFKLMVNTVITPETIGEADSILDWANDLGIWYSPVPMNCGPVASGGLMANPEYKALVKKIIARKKEGKKILGSLRLISRLLEGDNIECHPTLKPHVDPDGSLLWPCKGVANFEPVKINMLNYNSLDEAYFAAGEIVNVDKIHGHAPGQCGADCNWMQNYVSDVYYRGMKEPIKSGVFKEIAEFVGLV